MNAKPEISVRPYDPGSKREWQDFLSASNNGTLFHDQDFLGYHPAERFKQHSLMLYQGDRLRALFPAAIHPLPDGQRILQSPFGASIGGLVLADGTPASLAMELIGGLQSYAKTAGVQGIEMRIGPNLYQTHHDDLLPFGLASRGFKLTKASLTFVVAMDFDSHDGMLSGFSKSKRYDVRKSITKGVTTREAGREGFDAFHRLMVSTYARHGNEPTHRREELEKLMELTPGKIRIFLAEHEGRAIAGVCVFVLNRTSAYTYYICEERDEEDLSGPAVLIGFILRKCEPRGSSTWISVQAPRSRISTRASFFSKKAWEHADF